MDITIPAEVSYEVRLTQLEMKVLARICTEYVDALTRRKIPLPPETAAPLVQALHKMKAASESRPLITVVQ